MLERIRDILQEYVEVERNKISPESGLINELGLSSLDVVNIVVAFEDEFKIEIPDPIIPQLVTVNDMIVYLEQHT